jgi:hypothetical protein
MPKLKLTDAVIRNLPTDKDNIYWDAQLAGFGVIVSKKTGSKSFLVQRRLPTGKTRRIVIERCDLMPVKVAREEKAEDRSSSIPTSSSANWRRPRSARTRPANSVNRPSPCQYYEKLIHCSWRIIGAIR